MNEVRNRYYHDLESVFFDFVYICCICAGPHGLLRDDQNIFETHVGLWYGKKGQSTKQSGYNKWNVLVSMANFEKHIVSALHPYFRSLFGLLRKLRRIAIPPTPSAQDVYRYPKGPEEDDGEFLGDSGNADDQEDLPFRLKDMKNRDPPTFFKMYKTILRNALNDPNIDPPDDEGSTVNTNGMPQSSSGLQPPNSGKRKSRFPSRKRRRSTRRRRK